MLARQLIFTDPSIGRTPLAPLPRLGERFRAGRLFAKLESANPSGLHKDRPALRMVEEALARGLRGVTVGTCGSVGVALARLARRAGLPATVFVPARYRSAPIAQLVEEGARVVRTPGGYEDAVAESVAFAAAERFYDANPTGDGGGAALAAYEAIAEEVVAALGGFPDSVWVPVGNGTTLAGVGRGFLRLAAATGRAAPRLCGAGSAGNTAAVRSLAAGRVVELAPDALCETPVNEPLLNWRSAHAAEALAVVQATGGCAHESSDAELVAHARALADLDGVSARPAACAALAGLAARLASGDLAPGIHVVVLTA